MAFATDAGNKAIRTALKDISLRGGITVDGAYDGGDVKNVKGGAFVQERERLLNDEMNMERTAKLAKIRDDVLSDTTGAKATALRKAISTI